MLKAELLDELRLIAFSGMSKPTNIVAACAQLFKHSTDINKIKVVLESLAKDIATPDSAKIKALDLLDKVTNDTGTAANQQAVDANSIKETLLEQYTGCQS